MHKSITISLFLASFVFASPEVELLANHAQKQNDTIEANGNILVFSENYFISANRAIYNQTDQSIELFGDINILRGETQSLQSEHAKITLDKQTGHFTPFFTYDDKSNIWVTCDKATSEEKFYITKNAVVSSCNIKKPDWKIVFKEGKLNKDSQYLFLKNAYFYVKDLPVFYLPYFVISTNTKRRTGLLVPTLSYNTQGFYYQQPFYFAPRDNWDFESSPQIRTKRGVGIFNTLRFVHSPYSSAKASFGYFKDKNSYAKKENLKNNEHFGLQLTYENQKLSQRLRQKGFEDGMYLDFTYLNDIDYINVLDTKKQNDSIVSSRLNYFVKNDENYYGIYSKYYIDTTKQSNAFTMQELPSLQYHKYLKTLFLPNILYSADLRYNNLTRKEGSRANQLEFRLPIGINFKLLNDYLNFSFSENIYTTYINYIKNGDNKHDYFINNYNKFSFFTNLVGQFYDLNHVINFGVDYVLPNYKHGEIAEDYIKQEDYTRYIDFYFTQYFYDQVGVKRLSHSISAPYVFSISKIPHVDNKINIYLNKLLNLKNNLRYEHENKRFSLVQTSLEYKSDKFNADLIHTYRRTKENEKNSFIVSNFAYNISKKTKLIAQADYSFAGDYFKEYKIGIEQTKKCWNYVFYYKEKTMPKLTSDRISSVRSRGFLLGFELYPLGGTSYNFNTKNEEF